MNMNTKLNAPDNRTAIIGVWYLSVTSPNKEGMWLLLAAANIVLDAWNKQALQKPSVDMHTQIDMIQDQSPITRSRKVFIY